MGSFDDLKAKISSKESFPLNVETLGKFRVTAFGESVDSKRWGREKAIQLFQYLITSHHRNSLHKEQIADRIWDSADTEEGDRNFKVALHALSKALEPNKKSRTPSSFIIREGQSYRLNFENIWLDIELFDKLIKHGNQYLDNNESSAIDSFQQAIELYQGIFLPNRVYEDWASAERERLQLLAIDAYINLSKLLINSNPSESIRLTTEVLSFDPCLEEAYRIQMKAFLAKGNRPQAIKSYNNCVQILEKEYGISPLPETQKLLSEIKAIS